MIFWEGKDDLIFQIQKNPIFRENFISQNRDL